MLSFFIQNRPLPLDMKKCDPCLATFWLVGHIFLHLFLWARYNMWTRSYQESKSSLKVKKEKRKKKPFVWPCFWLLKCVWTVNCDAINPDVLLTIINGSTCHVISGCMAMHDNIITPFSMLTINTDLTLLW